MKKLISFVVLSLMASSAMADTFVANTAKNQRGEEVRSEYGGFEAKRIYSTTEEVVCTGRCVLKGFLPSTGSAATMVSFYDTSVTGALAAAELKYYSYLDPSQTQTAALRVTNASMRFTKGISVKLSSITAAESVTVLYVDLDQR